MKYIKKRKYFLSWSGAFLVDSITTRSIEIVLFHFLSFQANGSSCDRTNIDLAGRSRGSWRYHGYVVIQLLGIEHYCFVCMCVIFWAFDHLVPLTASEFAEKLESSEKEKCLIRSGWERGLTVWWTQNVIVHKYSSKSVLSISIECCTFVCTKGIEFTEFNLLLCK